MSPIPILLTCDIHTHTYGVDQVRQDLEQVRSILLQLDLPCTFFFPSRSAIPLKDQVQALRADGHEIGCHGLTHDPSEQFSQLPGDQQREFLTQATDELTQTLGERPTSFRAPAFKLSGYTVRVLDELGFQADLSVNSQRLGIFGSDLYNLGPLRAPRRPYHPSWDDPYAKGEARLLEIPVSAWILPFVSNSERLLGIRFMRSFFHLLYKEASTTGKPIVFVFHPEDMNPHRGVERKAKFSWRHLLPSMTHGFEFRYLLFEHDWRQVQRDQVALVRYMSSFQRVRFLTVREYLKQFGNGTNGGPP